MIFLRKKKNHLKTVYGVALIAQCTLCMLGIQVSWQQSASFAHVRYEVTPQEDKGKETKLNGVCKLASAGLRATKRRRV